MTATRTKYAGELGRAGNELYAQFFVRVVREISGAILGMFSKLKHLQSPNFSLFRETFSPKLKSLFLVPAATFDNVRGQFPIGFQVWQTSVNAPFREIMADVFNFDASAAGMPDGHKLVLSYYGCKYLVQWIRQYYDKHGDRYAYLRFLGTDFQNNSGVFLTLKPSENDLRQVKGNWVTPKNIQEMCVYFAVRHCIDATWLNDRDQFLYPKDSWNDDEEFKWNCLVFSLFHGQNYLKSTDGINHWVPFSEEEIGTRDEIKSHFMIDLLAGKAEKRYVQGDLLKESENTPRKPVFSPEARAVLEAGKALYRYYHAQPDSNPDASFYDIRLHFQGTDEKGRMNAKSGDETYNARLEALRAAMKELAGRIADGVYRHGFLK